MATNADRHRPIQDGRDRVAYCVGASFESLAPPTDADEPRLLTSSEPAHPVGGPSALYRPTPIRPTPTNADPPTKRD